MRTGCPADGHRHLRAAGDPAGRAGAPETRALFTATFVETSIVIESRYGAEGLRDLDLLIANANIDLGAVDAEQAHGTRDAFSRFGKGRHPANLNYGDCFSYALAKVLHAPLLHKGGDFSQTDITAVLADQSESETQ
jgi:ribonuclease VapC